MSFQNLVAVGLAGLIALAGCDQTAAPVRRDILGSWLGQTLPGIAVRMTLAETARSVDGAGGWTEPSESLSFRVFGAMARDEVSLYFDFSEGADISFQGFFVNEDRIDGFIFGRGFRDQPFSLSREDLSP